MFCHSFSRLSVYVYFSEELIIDMNAYMFLLALVANGAINKLN